MSEMSDQVRAIIFVVLVVLITFVWMHFYKPPAPPPQKPGQTVSQTAPGAGTAQPGTPTALSATPPSVTVSFRKPVSSGLSGAEESRTTWPWWPRVR